MSGRRKYDGLLAAGYGALIGTDGLIILAFMPLALVLGFLLLWACFGAGDEPEPRPEPPAAVTPPGAGSAAPAGDPRAPR
jgi:hypothetical protein